ncbi:MAG: hypothetical protein ACXADX_02995 [Candidatus Hodarchaeales archaeon]|jgi:hypothetical protein
MALAVVLEAALLSAVFLFLYLNLWSILALILKDNSIMDYACYAKGEIQRKL